jgi:hypothetical protein
MRQLERLDGQPRRVPIYPVDRTAGWRDAQCRQRKLDRADVLAAR